MDARKGTSPVSAAAIPAHLQPKKYRVTYECVRCSHQYKRTLTEPQYLNTLNGRRGDPPCPKPTCIAALAVQAALNTAEIIATQRAPAKTGSTLAKACDFTARAVMEDYGLTNLRDDNRPGENSMPKLPAPQQAQADAFFGTKRAVANPAGQAKIDAYSNLANSGALAHQPDAQAVSSMLSSAPKLRHVETRKM